MDYSSLNRLQRNRMKEISKSDIKMKWENPEFIDTLMGLLPTVRHYQNDNDVSSEVNSLEKMLSSYDPFISDKNIFILKVNKEIKKIQTKKPNWYGLNGYEIEECVRQHEFCLISGEGGIGKSYFIKCFEEGLDDRKIPHLCIYGKFEKDTRNIDIEEIITASSSGFVFIVDAINEMSEKGQNELLQLLAELKKYTRIRIVVTYRTNAMDANILERYKEISSAEYCFAGISFESALETIIKLAVPNVYKYEDILYSNNALLLGMLCNVLADTKIVDEKENSIASITFILEHFIKNSISKIFKGQSSVRGIDIWDDTKIVAKWMYDREEKQIDEESLLSIVKTGTVFVQIMLQLGFMTHYEHDSEKYFYFSIDSLTDFLIARSLFEDIMGKSFEEQVDVIDRKVGKLYSLKEAVIIVIFDNLAPNYEYINKLLSATDLIESLQYETLVKINFKGDTIGKFLKVFHPQDSSKLLAIMGGYMDKPFNCTNYLNKYYSAVDCRKKELSTVLSGFRFLGGIKGRLKNILYFMTIDERNNNHIEEAYNFALLCCAAPNKDVRCLAMKLLYEVITKEIGYKKKLIEVYEHLADDYIKEAAIKVLANTSKYDTDITDLFKKLIIEEEYLTAKSVKRISTYLNDPYGYINWHRKNLYTYQPEAVISDVMSEILLTVELMNKDFLPFRYWGKGHIEMHTKFLKNDKQEISAINKWLEQKYACVKDGVCNGSFGFEGKVIPEISGKNSIDTLDLNSFFCSYDAILNSTFESYQVVPDKKSQYMQEEDFHNSVYMKCVDIATDQYYGSLMCNYFTSEFSTYNNFQDSIGYEVYDPIEYGEEVIITSPIPTYQNFIEKLGDSVRNHIEVPMEKNLDWVTDVSLTRKNVLSLLDAVEAKNVEWVMIAGRVSLKEKDRYDTKWQDTYILWCCTSASETIKDDGNAKYLTIELEDYFGSLVDYRKHSIKPWLCKNVKNIAFGLDVFDNTSLVLPPAELITFFDLRINVSDVSWINTDGEKVIICNNNRNSYYSDPIGGTIFIRKDYLEKYLENNTLKYFVFTERFIPETGIADDTSIHFEIQDGKIVVEILNNSSRQLWNSTVNPICEKCPYKFKERNSEETESVSELIKELLEQYKIDDNGIENE